MDIRGLEGSDPPPTCKRVSSQRPHPSLTPLATSHRPPNLGAWSYTEPQGEVCTGRAQASIAPCRWGKKKEIWKCKWIRGSSVYTHKNAFEGILADLKSNYCNLERTRRN